MLGTVRVIIPKRLLRAVHRMLKLVKFQQEFYYTEFNRVKVRRKSLSQETLRESIR